MDCSRCTQMLDDPDRALADAAARVDGDEADPCCRETLELLRLERGMRSLLPVEEPHPALDSVILKAAAARVATPMAAIAAPPVDAERTSSISFVVRLRRWVTAPQVAMATITALAVVIGVFYVPSQRTPMEAHGDTVMSVPSAAAPEVEGSAEPSPIELAPPTPVATGPKPDDTVALATELRAPDEPADEAELGRVANADQAATEEAARADMIAMAEAPAPAESFEAFAADRAVAPPSPSAPTARSATRAMAAPATAPAIAAESAAPAAATASDALVRARVLRSRGQCAAAIPLYEQWLESGEVGPRGDAMLELANCYTATGRADRARRLYERATSVPQVASRARAELDSLDATASRRAAAARAGASTGGAAAAPPAATAVDAESTY